MTDAGTGRPFVFLDRDGTLVHDAGYTHRISDYRLIDRVVDGLRALSDAGYALAIVTNQSGIARGYYGDAEYEAFQRHLEADLAGAGIRIEASFHCPHMPDAGCACRKPSPHLLERARDELGADIERSWVIGDSIVDVGLAEEAGCRGAVLVLTGRGAESDPAVPPDVPRADDLVAAARVIAEGAGASGP